MEPEDVTESLWCLICLERLPIDEEACVNHLIDVHGANDGPYVRNMTRLSFQDLAGRKDNGRLMQIRDLLDIETIREKSVQPPWSRE